ncbi:MAG: hypothetical protein MMC23_005244 [Stictis urceolatum]|nr:hypothetical protein [Stictis urceolata]
MKTLTILLAFLLALTTALHLGPYSPSLSYLKQSALPAETTDTSSKQRRAPSPSSILPSTFNNILARAGTGSSGGSSGSSSSGSSSSGSSSSGSSGSSTSGSSGSSGSSSSGGGGGKGGSSSGSSGKGRGSSSTSSDTNAAAEREPPMILGTLVALTVVACVFGSL